MKVLQITKEKDKKNQKSFVNYFIRINPDKPDFNDYEEFGSISAYITESIKIRTGESLVHDLLKRLQELEIKLNHSIKLKCLKQFVKKILPYYKE